MTATWTDNGITHNLNLVGMIVDFENGDQEWEDTLVMFCSLMQTGVLEHLNEGYKEFADELVADGCIVDGRPVGYEGE